MAEAIEARKGGAEMDPFQALNVIERLEVGPVALEKRRLTAPYRVTRKGETHETGLIYKFEEDVFDANHVAARNLGCMMAVQPALNYGLFCREIVFWGQFDKDDRRFIREMIANTAREIYVKKFLEPNPFLRGEAAELSPVKKEGYLLSNLVFKHVGPSRVDASESDSPWGKSGKENARYAVLSSGGKDSLLSFGLLNEMGVELHPVFVNESGRHWFTALNAYRHFKETIHNTSRVWTNSDRVFSWMLRHLPFVRQDFASVRSDEYPIRLWTVAVFIFGTLPLLLKRGVGRLVIGDEYDTTRRFSFKGITHHDGLFDQSRYFDNALTRYFHRKGWGISQFSILRPLSELLIEKILVERYPELQRHQVSCHAAHKDGERVKPCGRCEKCMRIIALLRALDADAGACGYTPVQVDRALMNVTEKGIHQEAEGIRHLAFLLQRKGLLAEGRMGEVRAGERSEIMKLRFDGERSPLDGIPLEIRAPLHRICMAHSEGAVKRHGRTWVELDLWTDGDMTRPYPFEHLNPTPSQVEGSGSDGEIKQHLLGELTWPEAKRRFEEVDVALLPVGAIEQHGPHLPLDCDAFDADYLAKAVAEQCASPRPLVLPLVSYGVSYHHEDFSGTLSVNPETLSQMVYDIGMSAVRHGITKLVIVNGHGGNSPALHFAAQMINRDAHIFTCVDTGESSDPDIYAMAETPNDVHAGEIETSTTLATRPHMVRSGKIRKFVPRFSSRYLDFTSRRSVGWYAHTSKISSSGVMGDPTKGSVEKGERIWKVMIENLAAFVQELQRLSLDEIYQKRY
ncbi:MAG: creatininase family protein [Deltaproteobacteria bacterium]|nr:creatininase family protein [Deltaproteobacteria bacterium]